MSRGRRRRIAKYIYEDRYGRAAVLIVRGHREEVRFPLGTPVSTIRREMDVLRDRREEEIPEGPGRGTLAAAVNAYLQSLPNGAYRKERSILLARWASALGTKRLATITKAEIIATIDEWAAAGHSANRMNKRISALRVLWRRIAPDRALPHAIERVTRRREPKAQLDRSQDLTLADQVIEGMPDLGVADRGSRRVDASKARARLRCLLWTGQPAALLRLVKPEHIRWDADPPELYIQPRRKGAGIDAAWVPLVPQAVKALRALFAAGANGGTWNRGVLRRAWRRAVKRTQAELRAAGRVDDAARLQPARVYDLRHTFLTALGKASGDVYAVAEIARHSDIRTTQRYLRGASSTRSKAGIAALSTALTVPKTDANGQGRKVGRKRVQARMRVKSGAGFSKQTRAQSSPGRIRRKA